jgi:hypothetical protein
MDVLRCCFCSGYCQHRGLDCMAAVGQAQTSDSHRRTSEDLAVLLPIDHSAEDYIAAAAVVAAAAIGTDTDIRHCSRLVLASLFGQRRGRP